MIIDSHCHLASHKFPNDALEEIILRAKEAGVTRMVTLSTSLDDCPQNLRIADQFPEVFACIGIHPCDVHDTPDAFIHTLTPLAQHPRCVAIGETGLDYFHPAPEGWTDENYHARQQDFLHQHFQLAAKL